MQKCCLTGQCSFPTKKADNTILLSVVLECLKFLFQFLIAFEEMFHSEPTLSLWNYWYTHEMPPPAPPLQPRVSAHVRAIIGPGVRGQNRYNSALIWQHPCCSCPSDWAVLQFRWGSDVFLSTSLLTGCQRRKGLWDQGLFTLPQIYCWWLAARIYICKWPSLQSDFFQNNFSKCPELSSPTSPQFCGGCMGCSRGLDI